jgi:hypothetical protein
VTRRRKARAGGRAKVKVKMPPEQRFRGARGVRVTVHATSKHSPADIAADLREIADRLDALAADVA